MPSSSRTPAALQPRSWCLALAAIFLAGCGGAPVGHTRPSLADRTWLEVRSPGFVLVTDLGENEARSRLLELERHRMALMASYSLVAPHRRAPSLEPMKVIFFAHAAEFDDVIWRGGLGGFVTASSDFASERIIVTSELRAMGRAPADAVRREIMLHEVAHLLNRRYFGQAPVWLNEGLASFYQTLEFDDHSIQLGVPSTMARAGTNISSREFKLPRASALLALDYASFYGSPRGHHYVAAWFLIHLLNSPKYLPRFRNYLTALSLGVNRDRAWSSAFDSVSMQQLDDDYYAHWRSPDLQTWRAPFRPPPQALQMSVRRLRPGEVHAMWANLQIIRERATKDGPMDLGDARRHAALARELDPTWTGGLYWSAVCEYRARDGSIARADELMREYTDREPGDPRGWYARLDIELFRLVPSHSAGLAEQPPAGLDRVEPLVARLAEVALTSEHFNLLAWYYALAHRPELGLPFAQRALEIEPGDPSTLDTMALLLHLSGRTNDALIMQEQAINLLGESTPGEGMLARLALYRQGSR